MNDLETQLSKLFNAAVGEPPNRVTAYAARRQAVRRWIFACVAGAGALAVAGSIGFFVSAKASPPNAPAPATARASEPKYVVDVDLPSPASYPVSFRGVVRSTATGAITGRVPCPGPSPHFGGVAAADQQDFFVTCEISVRAPGSEFRQTGTRIYRFQLSGSGRIEGFRPVPGGNISGWSDSGLATTPSGAEIAISLEKLRGRTDVAKVVVMDTATGVQAAWLNGSLQKGTFFMPGDISLTSDGRELAVSAENFCIPHKPPACHGPAEEMLIVSPAAKGGLLSHGRVVFTSATIHANKGRVAEVVISPDGSTFIAGVQGTSRGRVIQISAVTGKSVRTLLAPTPQFALLDFVRIDPSGRFVAVGGEADGQNRVTAGWIDHGRLRTFKAGAAHQLVGAW